LLSLYFKVLKGMPRLLVVSFCLNRFFSRTLRMKFLLIESRVLANPVDSGGLKISGLRK